MKFFHPLFISICLLANLHLAAQPADPSDPRAGLADEIFKNKENNPFLFKWNASALRPVEAFSFPSVNSSGSFDKFYQYFDENHLPFSVSLEGLVANRWSLQANFAGAFFNKKQPIRAFFETRIEGRYYLGFVNEAKSKRRGNNLNGFYTAIDFSVFEQIPKGGQGTNWIYRHDQTATIRLGFQSMFLRSGFFDASLGFGRKKLLNKVSFGQEFSSEKKAVFTPRLNFGWSIGSTKSTQISQAARDFVFQKNRPTRQIFKFDLLNLVKFRGEGLVKITPSLAWEMRVFRRFSVEMQTEMPFSRQKNSLGGATFIYENTLGLGGGIEPRFIFAGYKRGSLNGWFFGWNISRIYFLTDERDTFQRKTWVLGLQSRLFEKGFIGYKIGYGNTQTISTDKFSKNHLFSELKAGLVF